MFAHLPRPRKLLAAAALAGVGAAAFADPPPPRRPDPISIDMPSPSSLFFGRSTSEIYGENPPFVVLGFGHDVFGPGPIPHVAPGAYGVMFFDEVDAISNGEIREDLQQILYFSVSDPSIGMPLTPVRHQSVRDQAAGDRWVTNGRTSLSPAAGGPALIVLPGIPGGPRHLLSANQTRFNLIPSVPPPAFNPGPFIPEDDMDGLELTLIDLTGDLLHDTRIYFSFNAGSAAAYGISGADLQYAAPGVPWAGPFLGEYAPSFSMGLLAAADDLDAVAVWDRGVIGRYDPGLDIAIFSLRPGSASLDGPDNIAGNADDYSPADVLITRFAGTHGLYVAAGQLGLLRSDDIDGLDVEVALQGGRPQWFDWWVQRVNIDVPWCPPPWNPPGVPPVNDFHVELIGIQPPLVRDPWTGSFPNATIGGMPGGTRISWTGATVPQGGVAHFGWEVMDDTQVQAVNLYWTRDGIPVECRRIPDLVQRWRVDAGPNGQSTRVVDVLQNRSNDLVFIQRRAIVVQTEMLLLDLMANSPLVQSAPFVDPAPIALQPGETVELPFQHHIQDRGYGVFYEVQMQTPNGLERGPMYMTALTVSASEDINQVTGACCLGAGQCMETTEVLCVGNGGTYLGDGAQCSDQLCVVTTCPGANGDTNCDGAVDFFDIDAFLLALFNPTAYQNLFCNGDLCAADTNDSGTVDFFDIDGFLNCVFNGCP
jgi:hypothetical protein